MSSTYACQVTTRPTSQIICHGFTAERTLLDSYITGFRNSLYSMRGRELFRREQLTLRMHNLIRVQILTNVLQTTVDAIRMQFASTRSAAISATVNPATTGTGPIAWVRPKYT